LRFPLKRLIPLTGLTNCPDQCDLPAWYKKTVERAESYLKENLTGILAVVEPFTLRLTLTHRQPYGNKISEPEGGPCYLAPVLML
jgi:hypothetical protein